MLQDSSLFSGAKWWVVQWVVFFYQSVLLVDALVNDQLLQSSLWDRVLLFGITITLFFCESNPTYKFEIGYYCAEIRTTLSQLLSSMNRCFRPTNFLFSRSTSNLMTIMLTFCESNPTYLFVSNEEFIIMISMLVLESISTPPSPFSFFCYSSFEWCNIWRKDCPSLFVFSFELLSVWFWMVVVWKSLLWITDLNL